MEDQENDLHDGDLGQWFQLNSDQGLRDVMTSKPGVVFQIKYGHLQQIHSSKDLQKQKHCSFQ